MMEKKYSIISIDFDGTLCENDWPRIGEPNYELINYVKMRKDGGDKLILNTMRTGQLLREAVRWCRTYGIVFDAVNDNIEEMKELYKNNPRKIYADIYIDDHNWKSNLSMFLPYRAKFNPDREITLECVTEYEKDFDRANKISLLLAEKGYSKLFVLEKEKQPKESYWIAYEGNTRRMYKCKKCGTSERKASRYCPSCGFKMLSVRWSK